MTPLKESIVNLNLSFLNYLGPWRNTKEGESSLPTNPELKMTPVSPHSEDWAMASR